MLVINNKNNNLNNEFSIKIEFLQEVTISNFFW